MEHIAPFPPTTRSRNLTRAGSRWLAFALVAAASGPLADRPVSAGPADTTVERTVHWAASPLRDALGHSLPPAAGYEVWLSADAGAESLVAVAADTLQKLALEPGVTCVVRVRAFAAGGAKSGFSEPSDPFTVPRGVAGTPAPALTALLGPAWPNPFNARVTLAYEVPSSPAGGEAPELSIHDLRGRRVARLVLDSRPGAHTVEWNAADAQGRRLPSGIYLVQFVCGGRRESLRLTLVS